LTEDLEILEEFRLKKYKESSMASLVPKSTIANSNDYNLSGERYKASTQQLSNWPLVQLQEISDIRKGSAITAKEARFGSVPVIAGGQKPAYFHDEANRPANTITVSASGAYAGYVAFHEVPIFASDCSTIEVKDESLVFAKYLYYILKHLQNDIYQLQQGGGQPHVYPKDLVSIQIPLPPKEVQELIVAELDGYAAIIDGAKKIVENWKPRIDVDPHWELKPLRDVATIDWGNTNLTKSSYSENGKFLGVSAAGADGRMENAEHQVGVTVLSAIGANCGRVFYPTESFTAIKNTMTFKPNVERLNPKYLFYIMSSNSLPRRGGGQPFITKGDVQEYQIPVPSLSEQLKLVEAMEKQESAVASAEALAEDFENRISKVISSLWNE